MKKLMLSFMLICGCATTSPKPAAFDGKWTFVDVLTEGEGTVRQACLKIKDVKKLREILVMKCEENLNDRTGDNK